MTTDKKFPASRKKRSKAREDGNMPSAQDLSIALIIIAFFLAVYWTLPGFAAQFYAFWEATAAQAASTQTASGDTQQIIQTVHQGTVLLTSCLLWMLLPPLAVAIMTHLAIHGFSLCVAKLTPDFGRLNPFAKLGRIFRTSKSSVLRFGFKVFKALGCICTLALLIEPLSQLIAQLSIVIDASTLYDISGYYFELLSSGATYILFPIAVFGIAGALLERHLWAEDLRMDLNELKQEIRENEQDPHLKAIRLDLQREISEHVDIETIRKASLIVTNTS